MKVPAPLDTKHPCPDCHGTGANIKATNARPKWESGYVMCRSCNGNGLDPAAFFRFGAHPPLKKIVD